MGPPSLRLPTGPYPPQPSTTSTFRPMPSPSQPLPAQIVEDRPQDAEQLQDALASAGVDLKAEEFNLSQLLTPSSATLPQPSPFVFPPSYGGSAQLQQQNDEGKLIFNRHILSRFVDKIGIHFFLIILMVVAKQYNIPRIDNEVIMFLSLTLEHRLRHLISQMCLLARHRTSPLPAHPSRSPSNITTLLDLARAERQKEETFQSRKRARIADKEGPPEKKVAPSIMKGAPTSRGRGRGISTEMTSEAQKRSTDTTVNVMLGGGRKKRYSWMDTGGGGGGSPAPSSPGVVSSPMSITGTNREDEKLRGRTIERPGWITMKDALEAIEGDGGGEGGIGLGWEAGGKALWRGWARIKD
jgi:hypothetical protein